MNLIAWLFIYFLVIALTFGLPSEDKEEPDITDYDLSDTDNDNVYQNITDPSIYFYGLYLIKKHCQMQLFLENAVTCGRHYIYITEDEKPTEFEKDLLIKHITFRQIEVKILKRALFFPGRTLMDVESITLERTSTIGIENGFFDEFESLWSIDISKNSLETIDEDVLTETVGSRLKELILGSPNLTFISPTAFMHLTALETLSLTTAPQAIVDGIFPAALNKLKSLRIVASKLKKLDDDIFENLESLENLFLIGNDFLSIPPAINQLPKLYSLDMSNTPVVRITYDPNIYSDTLKKILYQAMDNLTYIEDCAFCSFPNLQFASFILSSSLTYIHENAFGYVSTGYSAVEILGVEHCNLSVIPENLLDWSKVHSLVVGNNPIACNCSMAWLIELITSNPSRRFHLFGHPTCDSPAELQNIPLVYLDIKDCERTSAFVEFFTPKRVIALIALGIIILLGSVYGWWVYQKTSNKEPLRMSISVPRLQSFGPPGDL